MHCTLYNHIWMPGFQKTYHRPKYELSIHSPEYELLGGRSFDTIHVLAQVGLKVLP